MKLFTFVQWSFLVIPNKSARICTNVFGHTVIQSSKVEKYEKMASFSRRGRKKLRIYSWYSLPDSKRDQNCFIRIPSSNLTEMRPLGAFLKSILSSGYHGNNDCYKNFNFSFHYIFPSSITVQSFITVKWQEKSFE